MQDNRTLSVGEEKQCARESLILQMMRATLCYFKTITCIQIVHTNLNFTIVKFHSNTRRFLWRFYWSVQHSLSTYNVRICRSCKDNRKTQAPFTYTRLKKLSKSVIVVFEASSFCRFFFTFLVSRPFPSCPKPLFLNKAREEALHMKIILFSSFQSNSFSKECLHLASVWKWELLELQKWQIGICTLVSICLT